MNNPALLICVAFIALLGSCRSASSHRPPMSEGEQNQYKRTPQPVSTSPIRRPVHTHFTVRPVDAVARDGELWIALEMAGAEGGSNVYTAVANVASMIYMELYHGSWVVLDGESAVNFCWPAHPAEKWGSIMRGPGRRTYPQVERRLDRNTTMFWISTELRSEMPGAFHLKCLDQSLGNSYFNETTVAIVEHPVVPIRVTAE